MDKKVLDWLLEGPAWLRYAVELQLLDTNRTSRPVLRDSSIRKLIDRLKGSTAGIPAIKSGKVHYTETGKAYWDLFFLADIGLSIRDLGLEAKRKRYSAFSRGTALLPSRRTSRTTISACRRFSSLHWPGWATVRPAIEKIYPFSHEFAVPDGGWHCYDDGGRLEWSPARWTI